ncbi:MAG TPA: hypothetical protein ENI80_03225 [Acidiferrobacteraceae bacterium]|nr:hypothetical protein [Acidiferrobacteraceae bacterium]
MKRVLTILTISLILAAVQSCGFHLRGKVQLSSKVSPVYVKSSDASFAGIMQEQLSSSGNAPAGSSDGAATVLRITNIKYNRIVRTVDTRGKVTGYVLNYELNFNVTDKGGNKLLADQRVQKQRDYNFDSTQVLAKESEETYLRQDMEKAAALQIIRQLAAISR